MPPLDQSGPAPLPDTTIGRGIAAEEQSPGRDIRFAANKVQPYKPVPMVLGEMRVIPPLAAEPVARTEAGDVYQTLPLLWGYGPLAVSELKINNAPIAEYVDIDDGGAWPGTLSNLPGLSTTILDVRITDQLPRNLVDISGLVRSSCPDWNGNAWATRHTVNPASLFRYVLQHPARRHPAADADIDLTTLQGFHEFCEDFDYEFSAVIDFEISLWDLLREICGVARATPHRSGGKWSVVWDSGTQATAGHITGANAGRFSLRKSFEPPAHAMRVKFANRNKDYQIDERVVYRPGYDADSSERVLEASPLGITDPGHAWRYATYQLAQAAAPERWSAQQGLESLEVVRGMRVTVQHDSLGVGIASLRVKGVQTDRQGRVTAIDLETPVFLDQAGATYKAKIRTVGDADVVVTLDQRGEETVDRLELEAPTDADIAPGDLVTVGKDGDLVLDALVTAVQRGETLTATVDLVPFQPGVYAAVAANPPAFVSELSDLPSALPALVVTGQSAGRNARQRIGNVLEPRLVFDITPIPVPAALPQIQIRESANDPWVPADTRVLSPSTCVVSSVVPGIRYLTRLRWALPDETRVGPWNNRPAIEVEEVVPNPPTNFTVAVVAGGSRGYAWRLPRGTDVLGVKIRYALSSANASWENMTDLHDGVLTASPYYSYQPEDAGTYDFELRAINTDGMASAGVRVVGEQITAIRALGRFKELTAYLKQDVGAGAPARPTTGSYNFGTETFAPPAGWQAAFPPHDADEVVYATVTTASDSEGDPWTPDADDWSSPVIVGGAGDLNIIYSRRTSAGAAPAASAGVPRGWHDDIANVPAGNGYIYVSIGLRARGATRFSWGTPEQLEGQDGPAGIDGATWHAGNTAPQNTLGANGDFYLRESTGDVYEKSGGTWSVVTNLAGADGANWHTGSTVPSNSLGADGDYYFRTGSGTTAGTIYRKASGAWVEQINITGEDGEDGSLWHSGSGSPSSTLGAVGDWYFRTANGHVFEKTAAATWTFRRDITGPEGLAGQDGQNGQPGRDGGQGQRGLQGLPGQPGRPGQDGEDGVVPNVNTFYDQVAISASIVSSFTPPSGAQGGMINMTASEETSSAGRTRLRLRRIYLATF